MLIRRHADVLFEPIGAGLRVAVAEGTVIAGACMCIVSVVRVTVFRLLRADDILST